MLRRPRRSTLVPYTTLFRARRLEGAGQPQHAVGVLAGRGDDVDQGHAPGGDRAGLVEDDGVHAAGVDRKSTRLNSSHAHISDAVFRLHKKMHSTILSFLSI